MFFLIEVQENEHVNNFLKQNIKNNVFLMFLLSLNFFVWFNNDFFYGDIQSILLNYEIKKTNNLLFVFVKC